MRKISAGNSRNFIIFTILIILIVIILVLFLVKGIQNQKEVYMVQSSSYTCDKDYNPITTENEEAKLKQSWSGDYYLEKQDKTKVDLGDKAIIYSIPKRTIDLYGTFYEVLTDGKVKKYTGKNQISNTNENRLFKLEDRKYLITGSMIVNDTRVLNTKYFLLVVLDKNGNAKLLNYELNSKTIKPMIIETTSFSIDVANEKMTFENGELDLKKILGSSNIYDANAVKSENAIELAENTKNVTNETEEGQGEGGTSSSSSSSTVIQQPAQQQTIVISGGNNGDTRSGAEEVNNGESKESENSGGTSETTTNNNTTQKVNFDRSATLTGVTAGTSYIDIQYYISDPQGRYKAVYLEVDGADGIKKDIALDKSKTTYRITDLTPNTEYTIKFGTKVTRANGDNIDTIIDVVNVMTLENNSYLRITKIANGRIYYTIKLDSSYVLDSGRIVMKVDGQPTGVAQAIPGGAYSTGGASGSFAYNGGGQTVEILLDNAQYDKKSVDLNLYSKIKNY